VSKRSTVKIVAVGRIDESKPTADYHRARAIRRLKRRLAGRSNIESIIRFIRTGQR
jgi:hypothetical protein